MPTEKDILNKIEVPDLNKVNDTTYSLKYNDNAEVEVGNIASDDFTPHAKIKRWKDGSSFAIELPGSKVSSVNGDLSFR